MMLRVNHRTWQLEKPVSCKCKFSLKYFDHPELGIMFRKRFHFDKLKLLSSVERVTVRERDQVRV